MYNEYTSIVLVSSIIQKDVLAIEPIGKRTDLYDLIIAWFR